MDTVFTDTILNALVTQINDVNANLKSLWKEYTMN